MELYEGRTYVYLQAYGRERTRISEVPMAIQEKLGLLRREYVQAKYVNEAIKCKLYDDYDWLLTS